MNGPKTVRVRLALPCSEGRGVRLWLHENNSLSSMLGGQHRRVTFHETHRFFNIRLNRTISGLFSRSLMRCGERERGCGCGSNLFAMQP